MQRTCSSLNGFLVLILTTLLSVSTPGCWAGGGVPPELLKVLQAYRQAVAAGDSDQVAALSRFPIASNDFGGVIQSPAILRERFQKIFRPEIVACFADAEPRQETGFPGYLVVCEDALAFGFEQHNGEYRFSYIDNANAE
ncbi:MAG TPA: hypothetical protein P5032_13440 [Candidatus Competibacter sp.]|nr:hypothetical protein [Candidatus Competibacter sp.]